MKGAPMWFSFDGESFETHDTEDKARKAAEEAMDFWSQDAMDDGWNELSTQVCYGRITHAVVLANWPHLHFFVPSTCEEIEEHSLVPVESSHSSEKFKPSITVTSVLGASQIKVSDGVHSIALGLGRQAVESLVEELQIALGMADEEDEGQ